MLMNLVCLLFGYRPLRLYYREGESRKTYINALQQADAGNPSALQGLIEANLELL
jgi:cell filamentation protein